MTLDDLLHMGVARNVAIMGGLLNTLATKYTRTQCMPAATDLLANVVRWPHFPNLALCAPPPLKACGPPRQTDREPSQRRMPPYIPTCPATSW